MPTSHILRHVRSKEMWLIVEWSYELSEVRSANRFSANPVLTVLYGLTSLCYPGITFVMFSSAGCRKALELSQDLCDHSLWSSWQGMFFLYSDSCFVSKSTLAHHTPKRR